jgi:hypothetical protein
LAIRISSAGLRLKTTVTVHRDFIRGIARTLVVPVAETGKKWIGVAVALALIKVTTAFNTDAGLPTGHVAVGDGQH